VVGEGYETLLTADYSQIEMRIMAHLSGDVGLIEAFRSGEDLHSFVGSQVFRVPPDDVTPEMRSKVKAMSYGLAYGLSAYGLSKQLTISTEEARGLITWAEDGERETSLRIAMTVMDDQIGYPLNPRVLDRAFMIRLKRENAPEWGKMKPTVECAAQTVSLDALKRIFSGSQGVPGEVSNRLRILTEKLEKLNVRISARAMGDMYLYCASCIPLMTCPPKQVLDYALSQRAIPHLLATAKLEVLKKLPELLCDMPMCLELMNQPLPLPPV